MSVESVELSTKQHRAALLAAEDELTNIEIATVCGVTDRTLDRWKKVPEFQAAVTEHIDALSRDLSRFAIARKDQRVAALQDRWDRSHQVIEARASGATETDPPEIASGLVVRKPVSVTVYEDDEQPRRETAYEYAVDTPFMAEMRALEKQAAQEAGQWTEKRDVTSGGKGLAEILQDVLSRPVSITVAEDQNPFDAEH